MSSVALMSHPRPSAWSLISVMLGALLVCAGVAPTAQATQVSADPTLSLIADPASVCSPGQLPTQWKDELHPPPSIRVLRSSGPHAGHVETAPFWNYVAVVMRAEYSTGSDKPPLWMRIGSITVKQYGWFKAMSWGGGRVSFTTTDPVTGATTTTTECFDVKDTTADQIYKPDQWSDDGTIHYIGHIPTPNIEQAMRETWQVTLRKWNANANLTRLFLTGYRSGSAVPCGSDSTGFKIFQTSLKDCYAKSLTMYETIRRYFEPVYIVNTRDHDIIGNGTDWIGDLGVLSDGGSSVQWTVYPGGATKFGAPTRGSFNFAFSSLVGFGVGNVNAARSTVDGNPGDPALLSDLVMVSTAGQVLVSRGTPKGLSSTLVRTSFGTGRPDFAVVGDFDGNLLADVGLLYTSAGSVSLKVMLAKGDGTFAAPVAWWSGSLNLAPGTFVSAADVNGDGKDDLIARDSTSGALMSAVSPPSCASFSTVGPCPAGLSASLGLGVASQALGASAVAATARLATGDFDRDGRSDVIALSADGKTILGMRAQGDRTFSDPQTLWSGTATPGTPIAFNVNPDGMSDLAVVGASTVTWFRTNEKSTAPATMTRMSSTSDTTLSTATSVPF